MIDPENSYHSLNQLDAKLKPTTTWSPAFSRALGRVVVFTLSSHWLLKVFPLSWLAVVTTLVFVLHQLIELRSITRRNAIPMQSWSTFENHFKIIFLQWELYDRSTKDYFIYFWLVVWPDLDQVKWHADFIPVVEETFDLWTIKWLRIDAVDLIKVWCSVQNLWKKMKYLR